MRCFAETSVRITKFNIATFKGFGEGQGPSDVTVRGPVEFDTDEVTAGFSFMTLVTLIVDKWPYKRCTPAPCAGYDRHVWPAHGCACVHVRVCVCCLGQCGRALGYGDRRPQVRARADGH